MKKTFQDSLTSFVTQTSPWQTEFREPAVARRIFLIFGLLFAAMSVTICVMGPNVEPPPGGVESVVIGIIGGFVSLWMLFQLLRHEMHLNFHYRTYNEIVGVGKPCRSRTGSFDEISYVYTRRHVDPKYGTVMYHLGLSFDPAAVGSVSMAYKRPAYDMMGSRDGEAMASYAQDLAGKMGRPYQSFG